MGRELRFDLGEIYDDLLTIDAFQRGVSDTQQANSLLGAKLLERQALILKRVEYLAWKRGITPRQMWLDILAGNAKEIALEEVQGLASQGLLEGKTGDDSVPL